MKKIAYFLSFSLLMSGLWACSSASKEAKTDTQASTETASTAANAKSATTQSTEAAPPSDGVSPLKKLSPADAPKGISYKGKPTSVYQFSDKEGEHLIVVAETGEIKSPKGGQDERDKEMAVHHLLKKGDAYSEMWKAQDYIRNCPFDLILDMRPESMEVTDLDKDGIAEISFAYFLTCISDVSPYDMKLLMYEGTSKYAMRGNAKLMDMPSKYSVDAAFKAAPAEFLKFAKEKWTAFEDQAAG